MNYKNIGKIRLKNRMKQLQKGDVILDKAFNPHAEGVTRFSLEIWDEIKKQMTANGIPMNFTKAEMRFTVKDWFTFILTHADGFKFVFRGLSSGYHGEGSRGTYRVLKECGFANADQVFLHNNENWVMRKYNMNQVGAENVE